MISAVIRGSNLCDRQELISCTRVGLPHVAKQCSHVRAERLKIRWSLSKHMRLRANVSATSEMFLKESWTSTLKQMNSLYTIITPHSPSLLASTLPHNRLTDHSNTLRQRHPVSSSRSRKQVRKERNPQAPRSTLHNGRQIPFVRRLRCW